MTDFSNIDFEKFNSKQYIKHLKDMLKKDFPKDDQRTKLKREVEQHFDSETLYLCYLLLKKRNIDLNRLLALCWLNQDQLYAFHHILSGIDETLKGQETSHPIFADQSEGVTNNHIIDRLIAVLFQCKLRMYPVDSNSTGLLEAAAIQFNTSLLNHFSLRNFNALLNALLQTSILLANESGEALSREEIIKRLDGMNHFSFDPCSLKELAEHMFSQNLQRAAICREREQAPAPPQPLANINRPQNQALSNGS